MLKRLHLHDQLRAITIFAVFYCQQNSTFHPSLRIQLDKDPHLLSLHPVALVMDSSQFLYLPAFF